MIKFSREWKGSRNPGKQRKYKAGAPLHIKQKFVHAHLSKDLRKKYGKRSIGLRKGDKVRILNGRFRKHDGKVEKISLNKSKIFVNGIETAKRDGTKKMLALHPSNVVVVELNMDDKLRQKILERK
ncbi:50S ribosomal protein L24 [Candidatus Woesearchaeota archaeon]|nr:50S ribosomal protein L24 [Candidatus Woesearchaeota archaeon]